MRPLAGVGSDTTTSGRRSPFRAELIVCLEAATPDQAVAADTLIPTSIDMIATTRLQAIKKQQRLLSLDAIEPDICGNMMQSPIPIG
jgi:hypothetical protein